MLRMAHAVRHGWCFRKKTWLLLRATEKLSVGNTINSFCLIVEGRGGSMTLMRKQTCAQCEFKYFLNIRIGFLLWRSNETPERLDDLKRED